MKPHVLGIRSDKDTHFSGAIAQHAKEDESIQVYTGGRPLNGIITAISIQSDQNLAWEIYLWDGSGYDDTDLDLDKYVDRVEFATSDGDQIGAANQYYYSRSGLAIPYWTTDGYIHLSLVNRSVTGKNAGGTGEVVVGIWIEEI